METEKLGKYRLLSLIATGGMGEVFLARQEGPAGFSKTVVIKRILRHLADDQGFIDMFLNEARLAAQLQHPNIAQIFGLEHEQETWFIAMEHVHGRSLRACLNEARGRKVRFPPRIAARICAQALQGLQFAHRLTDERGKPLGILHRDVSPDNVLVSFSGAVKLVDFGIAKAMTRSFTFTGRLKGKLAYMAPEQFVSGSTIDARIDVYAMGVLLHELVTLEMPSNVPSTPEQAVAPRTAWEPRDDLPPEVNAILHKALIQDPDGRWESAEAFAHALEEFIAVSGEPLTAAHVAGFLEELYGRDVVMTNPSVATMQPLQGGGRTDVLPVPLGVGPNPHSDLWAVSPTQIDPLLQGRQRTSGPELIAQPPRPAVPTMKPVPVSRRWPFGAAVVVLLLGGGLWFALRSEPSPRVVPPLNPDRRAGQATDAAVIVAAVELPPVEPPDAAVVEYPVIDPVEPPLPPQQPVKVRRKPLPRPGRVTVRVNPWAEVFYNGKSYGVTPLKHPIEVPAGNATFTLKNSQLAVNKRVTVKVAAGAEVVLKADLFKK